MYIYSFEKLDVWKEAIKLTVSIYTLTKVFPDSEKFGLTNQLRRATVSITSNIAEGTSRNTNKDKAHFITMAFTSATEVINQIIIVKELNFINEQDYLDIRKQISKITNMLNSLRNYYHNN
jgi:four helix bundle protein